MFIGVFRRSFPLLMLLFFLVDTAVSATDSGGLYAVAFPTPFLIGPPIDVGIIPTLDLTTASGQSPYPGVPPIYSIRYSGYLQADFSELYTITALTDDGIRIWIDNELALDHWKGQAPTPTSFSVNLVGGHQVPIIIEFFNDHFGSRLQLTWTSAHVLTQVIPSSNLYPVKLNPILPQTTLPDPPATGVAVLAPASSKISPVCLEIIKKPNFQVFGITISNTISFHFISSTDIYANVKLFKNIPTPFIILGGGTAIVKQVAWEPTEIIGACSTTIRKGDSLLIDSNNGEQITVTEENCGLPSKVVPYNELTPYLFDKSGYFKISAKRAGEVIGSLLVNVVEVEFGLNACEITFGKVNKITVSPDPALVDFSANDQRLLELSHYEQHNSVAQFISRPLVRGRGRQVARIHGQTTIVAVQNIDEFTLVDDQKDGFVVHEDIPGFWMTSFGFTMKPVIPYTIIHVEFYVPNATVNGESSFDVPATALDAQGHWDAPELGTGSVFTCHRLLVEQP